MTGILSLITFAPIVGVVGILILRFFGHPEDARTVNAARWIALIATLATFALSVLLLAGFDPNRSGFQFLVVAPWFGVFH